jgi:hypothetical protein
MNKINKIIPVIAIMMVISAFGAYAFAESGSAPLSYSNRVKEVSDIKASETFDVTKSVKDIYTTGVAVDKQLDTPATDTNNEDSSIEDDYNDVPGGDINSNDIDDDTVYNNPNCPYDNCDGTCPYFTGDIDPNDVGGDNVPRCLGGSGAGYGNGKGNGSGQGRGSCPYRN